MDAGRKLDALVAEKVMGLKVIYTTLDVNPPFTSHNAKNYSTDISAAWEIVENLRKEFPEVEITHYKNNVGVTFLGGPINDERGEHWIFTGKGKSVPEAICLAALHILGVKIEN